MPVLAAANIVVKITSEADTKAFERMQREIAIITQRHWLLVRGVKNVAQAFDGLGEALRKMRVSVKIHSALYKVINRLISRYPKLAKQFIIVKKRVIKLNKKLKKLKKHYSETATKGIKKFSDKHPKLSKRITSVISKLSALNKKLRENKNRFISAGVGISQIYAAGLMKLGKFGFGALKKVVSYGIKGMAALGTMTVAAGLKFGELDTSMEQMGVVAGISSTEVKKMTDNLIKGAGNSIFSMNEIAETMGEIGSMGVFTEFTDAEGNIITIGQQIEGIAKTSEQLAVASGFDDMTKAASTLMGAMRTFGYDLSQNADVANLLMTAANESALSMADMGTALQYVGQQSSNMGFSLEQTLAALGALRNQNIDAGIASRSLAQAFQSLSNPSAEASKWMRRLGINLLDSEGNMKDLPTLLSDIQKAFSNDDLFRNPAHRLEVLNEIFGQMGSRAILPLIQNLDETTGGFNAMYQAMLSADPNELTDAFERMSNTSGNAIKRLKNTLMSLTMTLGKAFIEPLMESTDDAPSFFETLTAVLTDPVFLDAIKSIGQSFATLASAILPILSDVLVELAPVLADIVGLIVELLSSEEVKVFIKALIKAVKKLFGYLMPVLESLMPVVKELFRALVPFMPVLDFVFKAFAMGVGILKPFLKIFIALLRVFEPFLPLLFDIGGAVLKGLAIPLNIAANIIAGLIDAAAFFVGLFDNEMADSMRQAANEFRDMGKAIDEAANELRDFNYESSAMDFDYDTLVGDDTGTGGGSGSGGYGSSDSSGTSGSGTGGTVYNFHFEGPVTKEEYYELLAEFIAESTNKNYSVARK